MSHFRLVVVVIFSFLLVITGRFSGLIVKAVYLARRKTIGYSMLCTWHWKWYKQRADALNSLKSSSYRQLLCCLVSLTLVVGRFSGLIVKALVSAIERQSAILCYARDTGNGFKQRDDASMNSLKSSSHRQLLYCPVSLISSLTTLIAERRARGAP